MYLCVCNRVTLSDYRKDPQHYSHIVGSNCGKCLEWLKDNKYPGTHIPITESEDVNNCG